MFNAVIPSISIFDLFLPAKKPRTQAERDVLLAQTSLCLRNSALMSAVNLIAATVILMTFWSEDAMTRLAAWYAFCVLFSILGFLSYLRSRNREAPKEVSGRFLRRAEWNAALIGGAWGAPALLLNSNDAVTDTFLMLLGAGMASGYTSIMGQLPRVSSRFTVACLTPVVFISIYSPAPFSFTIAIMTLVLGVALILGSLQSYAQLCEQVGARSAATQARSVLLDAIESINDAFVLQRTDGEIILSNSRYREWFPHPPLKPPMAVAPEERQLDSSRWVITSTQQTKSGDYVSVFSDVTDLKTRERELIAARHEAEQADEAKSRFLATMSHELRTPLNIVLGFSKLMTTGSRIQLSDAEVREYADNIHRSGDHLLKLINDIIEYSKLGIEKYLVEPERVELRPMLAKCISLAAGFSGIDDVSDISVVVAPKMGAMIVDEMAFQRILIGLLTNAIKFRGADKRIIVKAALREDGSPYIAIRDFGAGIAEDEIEKVFEAFYQQDPDLDRAHGGTGLGLTLCRHLARMHDGDVILKSRPGVGTTAMVVLPPQSHIPTDSAERADAA